MCALSTRAPSAPAAFRHACKVSSSKLVEWNLSLKPAESCLLRHPDDPNDTSRFMCIVRQTLDAKEEVVGLLALPGCAESKLRALLLTLPGAGGGQGPLDPLGGGGGGTYGGYNAFGRLANALPALDIAVILLHYPYGEPLGHRPAKGARDLRIDHAVEHAQALLHWFMNFTRRPHLPTAIVGWSMGGAVAIETAAHAIQTASLNIRGVATIASMKEITRTSPRLLVEADVDLLLMHNVNSTCKAANSKFIGLLAGNMKPMLFPDEDHGVQSAYEVLHSWAPKVLFFGPKGRCDASVLSASNASCLGPGRRRLQVQTRRRNASSRSKRKAPARLLLPPLSAT